ncbi:MAG: DUF3619 family protein [Burkholderiales bacterium]
MNEDDLAHKIVARLDDRLEALPADVLERLQSARRKALMRASERREKSGAIGAHPPIWRLFGAGLGIRLILPAAIVVAVLTGLIYWQLSGQNEDDLEAGLLAGELPIHAYIDPGFESWIQNASHSPRQDSR